MCIRDRVGTDLPGLRDAGQDVVAHAGRRHRPGVVGEPGGRLAQLVGLGPAGLALAQVTVERGPFEVVEGVEGIRADQGVDVRGHAVTSTLRQSRRRIRPSRILVLTVARGTSSSLDTCG